MATYKSLESLKAAILKEVRSAVDAAAQESKNVLQKNVDEFYWVMWQLSVKSHSKVCLLWELL